jgi:Beta-ketoacyl synthase, N-terminal domain
MEPIVVIGLGCRFPTVRNIHSLCELLCSGRDVLGHLKGDISIFVNRDSGIPSWVSVWAACGADFWRESICSIRRYFTFRLGRRGGAPSSASCSRPTWEALEDAGQDMHRLVGTAVGVFVSVLGSDYQAPLFRMSPQIDIAMTTLVVVTRLRGGCPAPTDFKDPV